MGHTLLCTVCFTELMTAAYLEGILTRLFLLIFFCVVLLLFFLLSRSTGFRLGQHLRFIACTAVRSGNNGCIAPSPHCAVAFARGLRSRILRWTGKIATHPVAPEGLYWYCTTDLMGTRILISCVLCVIKWRGKNQRCHKTCRLDLKKFRFEGTGCFLPWIFIFQIYVRFK